MAPRATSSAIPLACAFLLAVPLASSAAATSFCDPSAAGWALDWEDTFDGDSLDLSSWTPLTSDAGGNIGSCRDAYCTPANVAVANGTLILTSKAEEMNGYNFTTGAVNTSAKRSWKPSPTMRLCFSAILPGFGDGSSHAGAGVWPAGWMMPDVAGCWPDLGEIDILEMINGDGNSHSTYHWESNYPGKNCTQPDGHLSQTKQVAMAQNWGTAFNEWGVERGYDEAGSTGYIAYYLNSELVTNITSGAGGPKDPHIFNLPFYFILNTALGGPWPGPVNASTVLPTTFVVDYVRVVTRTG